MKRYTVHHAKSQLSRLIQLALQGEDVVITNRDKPVVRLMPVLSAEKKLGFIGEGVWVSPDFDAPLDDFKTYQ